MNRDSKVLLLLAFVFDFTLLAPSHSGASILIYLLLVYLLAQVFPLTTRSTPTSPPSGVVVASLQTQPLSILLSSTPW